ncbi:MAG: energy transducer TonB, partial [Candidatus Eremiobacteraeota bacterium]|nr:energy transducer TonB [Candidatus Eremiobacteraeota bacterium]
MIAAVLLAGGLSISLGTPASALTRAMRGDPPTVVTTDVGHIWTFDRPSRGLIRISTDDAGATEAVEVAGAESMPLRLSLPGHQPLSLAFGRSTPQSSSEQLKPYTDFTASTTLPQNNAPARALAYSLPGRDELILFFDAKTALLRDAFYGRRDALKREGLIPANRPDQGAFKAPVLSKLGGADYASPGQGTAFLRILVDERGGVRQAEVYISSGDAQLDRIAVAAATHDTFLPATRSGSAVPSVYFTRVDFVRTKPR